MTWNAFHRRGAVLREVADLADLRRDGVLPTDVPGVAETFRDDLDLIGALHLRWHQRLVGQVELAQQNRRGGDLETAVREGWAAAAGSLPGIRLVVDHALARPADEAMARALSRATFKERTQLAMLAGLTGRADEAAELAGRRIEREARELWQPGVAMPTAPAVDTARRAVVDVPAAPAPVRRAAHRAPVAVEHPAERPAGSATFVRRLRAALQA